MLENAGAFRAVGTSTRALPARRLRLEPSCHDTVPLAHLAVPHPCSRRLDPRARLAPPRAVPDSRRVLGDVANAPRAPASPVLALAAKLSTPSPVVSSETFDGWRVNANPSFSPSAEVTERASMPPKSPAEELAHRAALAAAKIRRGGSTSPPDYASHATPSPTERPRRSGSGSGSASGSERSKISSAERAKRMDPTPSARTTTRASSTANTPPLVRRG